MTTFKICKRTKNGWSKVETFTAEDNPTLAYQLRVDEVRLINALADLRQVKSNACLWDVCKVGEVVYMGCSGTLSEIWDKRWTPPQWWALEQARLDAKYKADDEQRARREHAIDFPVRADIPDRVRY